MKRAAIYARYSTDLQNERSCDDQIALCKRYCEDNGFVVTGIFQDKAKSGASTHGREGLSAMMTGVKKGAFDVVVVEALDRLSRDIADSHTLLKEFNFYGVELYSKNSGKADPLNFMIQSVSNQMVLDETAKKVRRGMEGVLREGRHAGGRAYGYDTVPGAPGILTINETEAAIVRRIFASYIQGKSPRRIAGELNRDGVPPPRRTKWNASTLNGNAERGSGILLNELYAGQIVWNKVRMVKNPSTGRRVSRPNPGSEWIRKPAEHLRIVDEDTWQAAQTRKAGKSKVKSHETRTPRHLLSGKLKCGCCQSGISMHDRDKTGKRRVHCSAFRESGSCSNNRVIYLNEIEEAVLSGFKHHLYDRTLIKAYIEQYNNERRRLSMKAVTNRDTLDEELKAVDKQYERTKKLYINGHLSDDDGEAELDRLRARKAEIQAELWNSERALGDSSLSEDLANRYLAQVEDLAGTLRNFVDDGETELAESFRSLVHCVIVYPNPPRQGFEIEVAGRLAALMAPPLAIGLTAMPNSGLSNAADLRYHSFSPLCQ
ncbi:recombinase family protein [Microvirga flavescens]|uniref:recombinase family protein n=1 Tax=Microvirga flavescens TaxID=2249811 RepID=UPI000DD8BB93|nr:recombinase family protein [Microvirga flavescens]